jgi:spoIIIJ-associated protein
MSSRERRIVHLALREEKDLRTESDGEGGRRSVVVYPGNYKTTATAPAKRERRTIP